MERVSHEGTRCRADNLLIVVAMSVYEIYLRIHDLWRVDDLTEWRKLRDRLSR